jgi:SAM-dependent methyltransferase/acyl carrier protein
MFVDPDAAPDQRLCDTPTIDSFMQFAGFLVNYFNNPSMEDVFVCNKIEHIEIGGSYTPDAKEWVVYSSMTEGSSREASSDVYVFEAESKKLVMVAFGFHFSRMSQTLLAKILKGVNGSSEIWQPASMAISQKSEKAPIDSPKSSAVEHPGTRTNLFDVLHNVTDIPLEDLRDESTLDDLGIDSLMATEVLNDIRSAFGLTIDLATFLFFPNVRAIWTYLDSKLGKSNPSETPGVRASSKELDTSGQNGIPADATSLAENPPKALHGTPTMADSSSQLIITDAYNAFERIQYGYDRLAIETKATNFWTKVYPEQSRLILAYVVEGFAALGCDMKSFKPGDIIPKVQSLPRHEKLVRQLYHMLEDAHLLSTQKGGFLRTDVPVDATPADTIYREILEAYPDHANVHKLVKVIGSRLAACLTGDEDGLQLIFGDKINKRTLEDVYENWPLLRIPTLLLGDFLVKSFSNSNGSGKFRILEVGAGTGGTTRFIVNHLRRHGIVFEYTFTDLSASLVATAKKQFKGVEGMAFEVLDIEKTPIDEHIGAFHMIIATNCIHATRRLDQSLLHLHKMLREDGALTLVEITKDMFWLDIVVGLFEGWWLFEDIRSHALVSETHWERCMRGAGFREVVWTDGSTPEAQTVRIIAGFPSVRPDSKSSSKGSKSTPAQVSMETVVYKQLGNIAIHADVYYPLSSGSTSRKMPIGKPAEVEDIKVPNKWQLQLTLKSFDDTWR